MRRFRNFDGSDHCAWESTGSATYTVRRSKHATLVASTADTVKFSTKPKTVDVRLFEYLRLGESGG
jgi:hypothetical protein